MAPPVGTFNEEDNSDFALSEQFRGRTQEIIQTMQNSTTSTSVGTLNNNSKSSSSKKLVSERSHNKLSQPRSSPQSNKDLVGSMFEKDDLVSQVSYFFVSLSFYMTKLWQVNMLNELI